MRAQENQNNLVGYFNIQNQPHNLIPYNNQLIIHSQNPIPNYTVNNFDN